MKSRSARILKYSVVTGILLILTGVITVVVCNMTVEHRAEGALYSAVRDVPYRKVAIVLGASKMLNNGWQNWYFRNRILAAEQLYKSGKCNYLILSGDNHIEGYNEPQDMRMELVQRGIPDSALYLDYAGFRTYDSMVRLKAIFGQDSCIVVSQQFHNERALYIANAVGIHAIGFNAEDISDHNGMKTKIRERFARVLVVADVLFGRHPKYYGEPVPIGIPQLKADSLGAVH
ncbi:MAG: YdcF family protein [Candidatus Kapabacteria bacterium]|nr:YdcF family protein [Candidatus Kapabacteria bacterium]